MYFPKGVKNGIIRYDIVKKKRDIIVNYAIILAAGKVPV